MDEQLSWSIFDGEFFSSDNALSGLTSPIVLTPRRPFRRSSRPRIGEAAQGRDMSYCLACIQVNTIIYINLVRP